MLPGKETTLSTEFTRRGHLDPVALLSFEDAALVNAGIAAEARQVPGLINRPRGPLYWDGLGRDFAWYKSLHAHVGAARKVATLPLLVDAVEKLLGPSFMLWGCELIRKGPGQAHRWHVDTECEEHGITVWLPLENVGPDSGIRFMESSHRLQISPQRLMVEQGLDLTSDAAVLSAARSLDAEVSLHTPEVAVGEFAVFAGQLWHASFNESAGTNSVLVLQYSPTGSRVRIPRRFLPPVEWHTWQPPVLPIRGPQAAPARSERP